MVFFCKFTKFPRFSVVNPQDFQCKIPIIFNLHLFCYDIAEESAMYNKNKKLAD